VNVSRVAHFFLRLAFLYNETDAFFPSIYLHDEGLDADMERRFIHVRLAEAYRTQERLGRRADLPIYAFTKFEYDPYLKKPEEIAFYSNVRQMIVRQFAKRITWK